MSALDSRSVNVALPTLSVYFDVTLAVVQWIPLACQMTIVELVLSMARLGDKLGRKRIYIWALFSSAWAPPPAASAPSCGRSLFSA